ncbi:MAG: GAF domain-containing protein [Candidatus Atribacteria bacterium]|nr:GAF domain-containing protein [Candidatus Atribacteria bacterium]
MEKDFFAFLLEHSPLATVVVKPDGKVCYGNQAFREFLGGSLETLHDPREYLHPEDVPVFWECLERVAGEVGRKEEVLLRTRSRKGEVRFTRVILWNTLDVRGVEGIVGYSVDVTRETELLERFAREERLLEQIVATLSAAGQWEDEEAIAREAVQRVSEIFGVSLVWLGRKEDDFRITPIAWFPVAHPYPGEITVRWDESPAGQGPAGRAIRSGSPQVCDDILVDPLFLPWREKARQYGFRSAATFPLTSRGRTFGVLVVYSSVPRFFTEERGRFVQLFAQGLALILVAANARKNLKERVRELEAVQNLAVRLRQVERMDEALRVLLEDTGRLIEAQAGMVLLEKEDHFVLSAQWGFTPSLEGFTIDKKELPPECSLFRYDPRLSADHVECPCIPVPEGFGPSLLFPLLSEERSLGALFFLRRSGGPVFTERELHFVRTISEIGGNTIRRLELYEEALRRLMHLESLRAVDRAITGNQDLAVTFEIILNKAVQEENVHAAAVFLVQPETQYLRCFAHQGLQKRGIEGILVHARGVLGKVVAENTVLRLDSALLQEDQVMSKIISGEGFRCAFLFPMHSRGKVLGVLLVFSRFLLTLSPEWRDFFENLAGQGAIAVENTQLLENLSKNLVLMQVAYDATIEGWAKALELRDRETEGHSERVTALTLLVAQEMGISGEDLTYIRWGALLHDIGKLGVPDNILLKPGPLTEEEWAIMRKHPLHAYEMLRSIPHLRKALDIPLHHHERFDGKGYPMGLEGKKIPLSARIFAVVDVYDALTSDRPYRKAWSKEKALKYIAEESGKAFDPEVVAVFLRVVEREY